MIGEERRMIETILRWLGYVKASELAIMKMERDGWKEAAQSWKRVAASKERPAAGFVHLGPRIDQKQEERVTH
jgi:hypothetical protein